jgi:hypothetical protein
MGWMTRNCLGKERDFSVPQNVQTVPVAQPAFDSVGNRAVFPWINRLRHEINNSSGAEVKN